MACIYHIYSTEDEGQQVYIGQTNQPRPINTMSNEGDGVKKLEYNARPMDHFSGLYSDAARSRENPMFFDFLMSHNLNSMVVEIYTEANNFGFGTEEGNLLDKFMQEGKPNNRSPQYSLEELRNGALKVGSEEYKREMSYYLDAAEILHNYIAYNVYKHDCMTYQIGAQKLSLVSRNGVVLNSTMGVAEGSNVIDSNTEQIGKVQQKFTKSLENGLDKGSNGKTFLDEAAEIILDDVIADNLKVTKKNKNGSARRWAFKSTTKEAITNLFARYIKDGLVHFYNHEGRNLELSGYEIHTRFDDLFSKYVSNGLYSIGNEKGFTIIDAITKRLANGSFADKLARLKRKGSSNNELLKEIKEELGTILEVTLPEISFASFINITSPNAVFNGDYKQADEVHYAKEKTDDYGQSFRYRAYFFFVNCLKKVIIEDPEFTVSQRFDIVGVDRYYRISMYRLKDALHRYYQNVVKHSCILKNGQKYIDPLLTIGTRNQGTTMGASVKSLQTVNGRCMLVVNETGEGEYSSMDVNSMKGITNDTKGGLYYQFSQGTFDDIEKGYSKDVIDLEDF